MSQAFDPYYKWLGIPPKDQPPHHYRLLGIELYEADADVIESAAEQRMSHVRSFQSGSHAAESQQVLNQIAAARICLLNPDSRVAYDAGLRALLAATQQPPTPPPAYVPVRPVVVAVKAVETTLPEEHQFINATPSTSARRHKKRSTPYAGLEGMKVILGSLAGLAIGYVVVCFVQPRLDVFGIASWARSSDAKVKGDVAQGESKDAEPLPRPRAAPSTNTPPKLPADDATPSKPVPETKPKPPPQAETPVPPIPVSPPPDEPMPGKGKQPPPPEAERSKAAATLVEVLSIKDPSKLLEAAAHAKDASSRYVLLAAARDEAAATGNCDDALRACDRIIEAFEVEPFEEKATALRRLKDTTATPSQNAALAVAALQLCEAAELDNRTALARECVLLMLGAARKSGDNDLMRKATLKVVSTQGP